MSNFNDEDNSKWNWNKSITIDNINNTQAIIKTDNNLETLETMPSYEIETQKAQIEAEDFLKKGEEEILNKEKFLFEPQSISLFRIYNHFFEPIDWIFLVLAIIGALGNAASIPALMYIGSDAFTEVRNTGEQREAIANLPPHIQKMILETMNQSIRESMNRSIKRQLIAGAISFVCNFLFGTFWVLIGSRCVYKLKRNYISLILSQEQGWFDSYNTYELANKVQAQLEIFEQGIGLKVGLVITGIGEFIAGYIFSFIFCWKVTLVLSCLIPIVILLYIILANILKNGIIVSRKLWENAGGMAEEIIYNIKVVASFANFEYELRRFYEKVEIVWRISLMNAFKLGVFNGIIVFCLYLSIFICFIYGRTLVGKELNRIEGRDLNGGDVFLSGLLILIGLGSMGIVAQNIKGVQESCASVSDYFNLYNRKPQMDFSQSIQRPPISQIQGKIEFKNVYFSYPSDPDKKLVLNGINLNFEPGKKIALVGESGCGKSTIVNLIERLYDITGGQLLIDGIEIQNYDIEYLRNLIGYVQQEPVLFNNSIRENIIFGRENYLSSIGNIDELVQNACDETNSSEIVNNLAEGFDYIVGLKGNKLSGGQRQRITIARAIIAKPKILILDEATSSLDNITEREIQETLDKVSQKNATTIVIAHRLSTIKNSDLIYVIKDGVVYEQGNHDQLLSMNGYYASMIKAQFPNEMALHDKNEEITREKYIKKNSRFVEVQFERRDNAISLSDKDISSNFCTILKELKNYKLEIFLACLGSILVGVSSPLLGFFMGKTIISLKSMYETVRYDDGLKYAFIFFALAVVYGIGQCLMIWKFMSLGLHLAKIYRKKLMAKFLSFHLSYFDVTKNSPGSLLTRMAINTMELNQILNTILGIIIQCSFILILGLILGCCYEYRITLINYCFIPVIIFINLLRRQLMESSGRRSFSANSEAGGILSECIINTKTIYSYNFQKEAIRMYVEIIETIKKQFIRDAILMGLLMALGNFCYFAANASVYATSKRFMINGSMDSEDMYLIMNLMNISLHQLIMAISGLGNIRKAKEAFRSIYGTLETPSLIPPFRNDNIGKISAMNIMGKIELRNVYFAYPTRPENVILKNISLTILPGQKVALVGNSGSGKSTIIQLLNRFYDIEEGKGEILIDDINIKNYNLYELRKKIGWVPQEPALFKISPLENVRYGRLNAKDEECIQAAKQANIMKFFNDENMNKNLENIDFSKKINSKYDSKNDLMSEGEKQRMCIARVFLKDPKILLLDEATSALDKNSELEVQKSLELLESNRTCISISHRLNTIENCDQIYVMKNGKIMEEGTHQELMNLKSLYYTLQKYSA